MNPVETRRVAEREALLAQLSTSLVADPRIAAAWLHGSLGRGDGDAWSDLDIWVVVFDDDYSDAIRHTFGDGALFIEEAPQNGPPGGSYLMSAHDAPTGPHLVDWYFQPIRFASLPEVSRRLVDRAQLLPVPHVAPDRLPWLPSAAEDAANSAWLFWAMILIQAKYIARKPVEDGMGFEGFLLSLLHRVASWAGIVTDQQETVGLRNAEQKLNRLRRLGEHMAEIAPMFAGPQLAVNKFLQTVRDCTESRDQS